MSGVPRAGVCPADGSSWRLTKIGYGPLRPLRPSPSGLARGRPRPRRVCGAGASALTSADVA